MENTSLDRNTLIQEILNIIDNYGGFTSTEVDAESSPLVADCGDVCHLAEEFYFDHVKVITYHNGNEIDECQMGYEDLDDDCLESILELAQTWAALCQEEEE